MTINYLQKHTEFDFSTGNCIHIKETRLKCNTLVRGS